MIGFKVLSNYHAHTQTDTWTDTHEFSLAAMMHSNYNRNIIY